jgi:phage gp46-like protein
MESLLNDQQGDVSLKMTTDGGDVTVQNGLMLMGGGLETMANLCLFGGNADDAGGSDERLSHWMNLDITDPDERYRSEFQNIIQSLPATAQNLRRAEAAAERDLAVFLDKGIAESVEVEASLVGLNRVKLFVQIQANGSKIEQEFIANWSAQS